MQIYLEIDVVMVPGNSWSHPQLLEDGFPAFSDDAIEVLHEMITDKATIILTTSHKSNYTVDEWKTIFDRRGLVVKELKLLPCNTDHYSRKDELLNWFTANTPAEAFVIIDDDSSLHALPAYLKAHWIQPSAYKGLTALHTPAIQLICKMN